MTGRRTSKRILCAMGAPMALRWIRGFHSVITTYHGVVGDSDWRDWETADMVPESVFRQHLALYAKHYSVVPLRRIADALAGRDAMLPKRALAITFDDGYRNNLRCAAPALKEHGFTATFFLTSGFVDGVTPLWWLPLKGCVLAAQERRGTLRLPGLGPLPVGSREEAGESYRKALGLFKNLHRDGIVRRLDELQTDFPEASRLLRDVYAPLTWADARELLSQGMEIGAHTVTHPILSRESSTRARQEIFDSVRRVKEELSQDPIPFSYPNGQQGDFSQDVQAMVRDAGCYAAVAGFGGFNSAAAHLYALRRFPIGGHHTVEAVELDLCGLRMTAKHLLGAFTKRSAKEE